MSEQKAIPDQLAEVRAKIAALKAEENALRLILIEDPTSRAGAEYLAVVRKTTIRRVSAKDLQKASPKLYAALVREAETNAVLLVPRG